MCAYTQRLLCMTPHVFFVCTTSNIFPCFSSQTYIPASHFVALIIKTLYLGSLDFYVANTNTVPPLRVAFNFWRQCSSVLLPSQIMGTVHAVHCGQGLYRERFAGHGPEGCHGRRCLMGECLVQWFPSRFARFHEGKKTGISCR